MHDAVQLEQLGVPAALIVTEPFVAIADSFSPTIGAAGYPSVAVPHPVSSKDDETLRKYASAIVDQVEQLLSA